MVRHICFKNLSIFAAVLLCNSCFAEVREAAEATSNNKLDGLTENTKPQSPTAIHNVFRDGIMMFNKSEAPTKNLKEELETSSKSDLNTESRSVNDFHKVYRDGVMMFNNSEDSPQSYNSGKSHLRTYFATTPAPVITLRKPSYQAYDSSSSSWWSPTPYVIPVVTSSSSSSYSSSPSSSYSSSYSSRPSSSYTSSYKPWSSSKSTSSSKSSSKSSSSRPRPSRQRQKARG